MSVSGLCGPLLGLLAVLGSGLAGPVSSLINLLGELPLGQSTEVGLPRGNGLNVFSAASDALKVELI